MKCEEEGCGKKLSKSNKTGKCRSHFEDMKMRFYETPLDEIKRRLIENKKRKSRKGKQ